MSYTTIYEAKAFYGLSIPFIILIIAFLLLLIYIIVNWKRNALSGKIGMAFVDSFLFIVIVCLVFGGWDAKKNVYDEYINGNYYTVEGVIKNYNNNSNDTIKYDYFKVDDVLFSVPGSTTSWGNPLRKRNGGVLKNGVKVRIYYVFYKYENVIMKVENIKT